MGVETSISITEPKLVYNEFKFWKDRYTTINKSSSIIIFPEGEDTIKLVFSNPLDYYYFEGTITAPHNCFISWINSTKDRRVCANMEEINIIRSCLKKNAVSIFYTSNSFTYEYLEKETGENKTISFSKVPLDTSLQAGILKSKFTMATEIPNEFLTSEIFEVYLTEGNKITQLKTNNKVLEIPSAKILSIQKSETTKYKLYISERNTRGQRLVGLQSANTEAGISFLQIFNTI